MIDLYDRFQDEHTKATSLSLTAERWFAMKLDFLCAFFVLAVSIFCIVQSDGKLTLYPIFTYQKIKNEHELKYYDRKFNFYIYTIGENRIPNYLLIQQF
jgi:hypothetical protein